MAAVRRGDVMLATLDPTVGVEIRKTRPVVVVSNDHINELSQLAVVVPLTKNTARLFSRPHRDPQGDGGPQRQLQGLRARAPGRPGLWQVFR